MGSILEELGDHLGLIAIVIILGLVNWSAEARKFKLLIAGEVMLTNMRALFITLGGMAISNFTPARTGEYIGRGLLLKKLHPVKVVIATVAGNLAQVLMTYSFGLSCIGIALLFTGFGGELTQVSKLIYVICAFICTVLFIIKVKEILPWVKERLPSKLAKTLNLIKKYDRKLYARVLLFSFIRYIAFSVQFYLLMQLFSDFALPLTAFLFVPVAYLLQSLVPVPAVSDIGVRVAVSHILFGLYLTDHAILQSVTCLWFINLILPGLLGTVYLLFSTIKHR